MAVQWAYVDQAGALVRGAGPEEGLVARLRGAQAVAMDFPGLPTLVVSGGPSLMWTVERLLTGASSSSTRYWGLTLPPGARLWPWPDGSMVGVGQELEDVERARKLISERL